MCERRFSINVWADVAWMKHIFYENQPCPVETIKELPQRVEVAAAKVDGIPGVFFRSFMLRRSEAFIASYGQHFRHVL